MLPDDVLPEPVPPGVESLPVELVPGVAEESVPLELVPGDPDLDLEDELSLVPLLPEPAPVEPVPELPLPVPLLPDCANAPVAPELVSPSVVTDRVSPPKRLTPLKSFVAVLVT